MNTTPWISVKDRLPDEWEYVLVCESKTQQMWVAFYHDVPAAKGFLPEKGTVSHWMALPEPPQEEES